MINRYKNRRVVKNEKELYSDTFKKRNVKFINQYSTAKYSYPDVNQYNDLTIIKHAWKEGDRFYKLAELYYGDARDWWIIARFNLKPTESHFEIGDIVEIPLPLDRVVEYLKG